MSITKIRNQFASCGLVAAGLLAIGLILGLVITGGTPDQRQAVAGPPAFIVNGITIPETTVAAAVQTIQLQMIEERRQAGGNATDIGPYDIVNANSRAVDSSIAAGVIISIANRQGIKTDAETVEKWLPEAAAEEVNNQYKQFIQQREFQTMLEEFQLNSVKEQHGEDSEQYKQALAAFNQRKALSDEKFFEQATGQSLADMRKSAVELYQRSLRENPARLVSFQADLAQQKLAKKYEAELDTSDEALKRSYDKYTFQQIFFEVGKSENPKDRAQEVLTKIRAGMDFSEAIDQFSDLKPPEGDQKPSEFAQQTQERFSIEVASTYKAILDLKPGEVSEVIELPTGASIYKLIKVEPAVPADFEAQKAKRASDMKQVYATSKLMELLTNERKVAKIEWKNSAYRLLYEYDEIMQTTGLRYAEFAGAQNQAKKIEELRRIFDELHDVSADSPELVACLRFVCFNQIDTLTAAGPDKDRLNEERLGVYADAVNYVNSIEFKFEYINVLIAAKMGDEALRQLLDIATNATIYSPETFPNVERVQNLLPTVANLASPNSPLIEQIQSELAIAKENAEEAKKFEEEERKAQEEAEQAAQRESQGTPAPESGG